jgi:hypothetical protein
MISLTIWEQTKQKRIERAKIEIYHLTRKCASTHNDEDFADLGYAELYLAQLENETFQEALGDYLFDQDKARRKGEL